MNLSTDILRFLTIGWLILLTIKIMRSQTPKKQAWPAVGFCTGLICYLIVDWKPMQHYILLFFLLAPTFATPFFFWLFSKSLFDDTFTLKKWMPVLLLSVIFFFYFAFISNRTGLLNLSESTLTLLNVTQQAIALLFVILAIVEGLRGKESDLLVSRIEFRSTFILLSALLMVLTILAEVAFQQNDPPSWLEFLQKLVIAALTFCFAIRRLDFKPGFFSSIETPAPSPPKPDLDPKLVSKLIRLVEGERYYRTEGLTIRKLSEKMEVKEYKLRQTINQHLGFRNFNDFLNSYRIAEACDLLSDPAQKELTVLETAYQMGYNSLAPFNKAFKETTGMTPTEWRRLKMP